MDNIGAAMKTEDGPPGGKVDPIVQILLHPSNVKGNTSRLDQVKKEKEEQETAELTL